MKSPVTGLEMKLHIEDKKIFYKNIEIEYSHHCYLDEDTNKTYTDVKMDKINLKEIEKQYLLKNE